MNIKAANELIKKNKTFIINRLEKEFQVSCGKIEEVMGKKLYRNSFIFYITTFGRAPYFKEKGVIFLPYKWNDPILTFLHELCHFHLHQPPAF